MTSRHDVRMKGCSGYGRGIAKSTDGGETWDTATLRGLPDTTPDVEGSFLSAPVTINDTETGKPVTSTCERPHPSKRALPAPNAFASYNGAG